MFVSSWNHNSAKIEVMSTGGSDGDHNPPRRSLVSTHLQWPYGLSCDLTNRLLYWADAKPGNQAIEVVDFDGRGRRKVSYTLNLQSYSLIGYSHALHWTKLITVIVRLTK